MSTMTAKVLDAIIVLNILEITTEELSSAFLEQLLVGLDFFNFFFDYCYELVHMVTTTTELFHAVIVLITLNIKKI